MRGIFWGILLTIIAILLFNNFIDLPDDNANNTIQLDLQDFYNGKMYGWGHYKNWLGREQNTFLIEVDSFWQDGKGFVDEKYNFLDGQKIRRMWSIVKYENNHAVFKASDIEEQAEFDVINNGYIARFDFLPKGSEMFFSTKKRFRLVSENTALVTIEFRKFWFLVGSLNIALIKADAIPLLDKYDYMDFYSESLDELHTEEHDTDCNCKNTTEDGSKQI